MFPIIGKHSGIRCVNNALTWRVGSFKKKIVTSILIANPTIPVKRMMKTAGFPAFQAQQALHGLKVGRGPAGTIHWEARLPICAVLKSDDIKLIFYIGRWLGLLRFTQVYSLSSMSSLFSFKGSASSGTFSAELPWVLIPMQPIAARSPVRPDRNTHSPSGDGFSPFLRVKSAYWPMVLE